MLLKTPLTDELNVELAAVPETSNVIEHWEVEASTVPKMLNS